MKILLGIGSILSIAMLCLVVGLALGLFLGIRAAAEAGPTSGAAQSAPSTAGALLVPDPRREVPQ